MTKLRRTYSTLYTLYPTHYSIHDRSSIEVFIDIQNEILSLLTRTKTTFLLPFQSTAALQKWVIESGGPAGQGILYVISTHQRYVRRCHSFSTDNRSLLRETELNLRFDYYDVCNFRRGVIH